MFIKHQVWQNSKLPSIKVIIWSIIQQWDLNYIYRKKSRRLKKVSEITIWSLDSESMTVGQHLLEQRKDMSSHQNVTFPKVGNVVAVIWGPWHLHFWNQRMEVIHNFISWEDEPLITKVQKGSPQLLTLMAAVFKL